MTTQVYYPFFDRAIRHFRPDARTKVLELGCADGELVDALTRGGYDAVGCDIPHQSETDKSNYSLFKNDNPNVFAISSNPYRLPFEDESFDVVLSCNVFEHVLDKRETLEEIYRVLKPGGYTFNAFPSKWYLPLEPHLFVPFVSWMWPDVPDWWLDLWAFLGVRNQYQQGFEWRSAAKDNKRFCKEAISYRSSAYYRKLVGDIFGSYCEPASKYVVWHDGASGRLVRQLPSFCHRLLMTFREQFFVARKIAANENAAITIPRSARLAG